MSTTEDAVLHEFPETQLSIMSSLVRFDHTGRRSIRSHLDYDTTDPQARAFDGKCYFYGYDSGAFGNGVQFRGGPINDPTWLDVARIAHQRIEATQDFHHTTLEGLIDRGVRNGAHHIEFIFGS